MITRRVVRSPVISGPFYCVVESAVLQFSQPYALYEDAKAVRNWLTERENGYPVPHALTDWPEFDGRERCSACEGATWSHRPISLSDFLPDNWLL